MTTGDRELGSRIYAGLFRIQISDYREVARAAVAVIPGEAEGRG